MSFGGHVLDMVNRMKQNRDLRDKLNQRHNRALDQIKFASRKRKKFHERELTLQEKESIRKRVRLKMKAQHRIDSLKMITTLLIVGIIGWLMYEYLLKLII
ncbi:MAG: hypothetical protein C0599_15780 [Salinivirgaceae bacterium]|nr:MAG: hypothetical protein C0599_15780 [Salinivirgaceae bacterium]